MTPAKAEADVERALVDPSIREPVKRFLADVRSRNPIDAADDADLVHRLVNQWADACLGGGSPTPGI